MMTHSACSSAFLESSSAAFPASFWAIPAQRLSCYCCTMEAAREGVEVAEAELSETRALLEQERAESAKKLAVLEEQLDAYGAELALAKSETELVREPCDRRAKGATA